MTDTDQTSAEVDVEPSSVPVDAESVSAETTAERSELLNTDESAATNGAGLGVEGSDDADEAEAEDADETDGDADAENPLEVEAEVAADYLEELLDIADLDGDIDTYVDGDRAHVSIVSNSDTLVGKGGSVLDALQELTRLAVMAETGQRSRLMLDVAGYRAKRRDELVALAADAVHEVQDSSEPVHLAAMNPFERKIVHDAVAAAGLSSESEGEEPRRHVVVLPARG